ncbi:MAG: hypothetical protein LBO77_07895 [Desulfovibrio sp.]|jgi:hypothetical protein|nr:hypothetical protein [Desulfovibrio sp.]
MEELALNLLLPGKRENSTREARVNTVDSQLQKGLWPIAGDRTPGENSIQDEDGSPLAKAIRAAGLARVAPCLMAALDREGEPGHTLQEDISDNIRLLQDAFVDALYSVLRDHCIRLEDKITLVLEEKGLTMACVHPERERIEAILASSPELSAIFRELAAQSAALRDLKKLRNLALECLSPDRFPELLAQGPAYRVCLKGDMSHFYFAPRA